MEKKLWLNKEPFIVSDLEKHKFVALHCGWFAQIWNWLVVNPFPPICRVHAVEQIASVRANLCSSPCKKCCAMMCHCGPDTHQCLLSSALAPKWHRLTLTRYRCAFDYEWILSLLKFSSVQFVRFNANFTSCPFLERIGLHSKLNNEYFTAATCCSLFIGANSKKLFSSCSNYGQLVIYVFFIFMYKEV